MDLFNIAGKLMRIPFALLIGWVIIIIHEFGHYFAGKSARLKFYTLIAGPIGIKLRNGKTSLFFARNLVLWGGVTQMLPETFDESCVKGYIRFVMGGPTTSIITGLIFVSIYIFTQNRYIGLIGILSVLLGLIVLIPMTNRGYTTDGKMIQIYRARGQRAMEEIAMLKMVKHSLEGRYIPEIPLSDFEILINAQHPDYKYYGNYCLYQYYIVKNDEENKTKTLDKLNRIKSGVSKAYIHACKL